MLRYTSYIPKLVGKLRQVWIVLGKMFERLLGDMKNILSRTWDLGCGAS